MGGNTDPDDFRKLLQWNGQRNFYDRFVEFWIISSGLETAQAIPYDFDRWKGFWGNTELDPNGELVVWKSPWWTRNFVELTTDHLQLDSEAENNPAINSALNSSDAGANLQELTRESFENPDTAEE